MRAWRCVAATICILIVAGLLAGLAFIYSGLYDVAATKQHNPIAAWALHATAVASIYHRAKRVAVPDLSDPAMAARGAGTYARQCAQCHGAPGVPPGDFARGIYPLAPPLMQVARQWTPAAMHLAIARGMKMTAMPAWEFRLSDREIWDVVAFLETLPSLSSTAYAAAVASAPQEPAPEPAAPLRPADASVGKVALQQYACASCHDIPGIVVGADALVGPPLGGVAQRQYLAGLLANTPANMVRWIRHPQAIKPHTAMPDLGVSEQHARDITAYLETLY
jgi:mono/diheme cytochrome c family protein